MIGEEYSKFRIDQMTIDALPDIVYHGTSEQNRISLENGIDLEYSKNYLDFGKGFYTTSNHQQAVDFAFRRAEFSNGNPIIISYNINKELFEQLTINCLIFDSPNEKWYEFIYNNRVKSEYMLSEFHNKNYEYDVVYGKVADKDIGRLTRKAQKKQIDFQEFVRGIKPFDDYDQMSFHTINSLKVLTISKIEIINDTKEVSLC